MYLNVFSSGQIVGYSFCVMGGSVGKLATIVSMTSEKLVWSNVSVMWVMSSANRVSHCVEAVSSSCMGYQSRYLVLGCCVCV